MTPAAALALLQQWRNVGWLRPLDLAFARFVHGLDPQAPGSLLLATGLLAQLEGQGHSCLPIETLAQDPLDLLAWPAAAAAALTGALVDWPADMPSACAAWSGHAVLQIEPSDAAGASPLVLSSGRLYLRRYWRHESSVAAHVNARTRAVEGPTNAVSSSRQRQARVLLDRLFPGGASPSMFPSRSPSPMSASPQAVADELDAIDWQKAACALALRRRLTLVTGGPGTGKTYTAARLLVLMQALHEGPLPLRVALAAPTGKAAARLRQSIETALHGLRERLGESLPSTSLARPLPAARTLHALLGARPGTRRFVHGAARPLDVDLVFVDEASMVDLETMAALLEALPQEATLVLLGDKDQLASVEAGAVMGELCRPAAGDAAGHGYRPDTARWVAELTGQVLPASACGGGSGLAQQTVTLHRSRRFGGPIGQLAAAVNRGDGAAAVTMLRADKGGDLALIEARNASPVPGLALDGRVGAPGGYRDYLASQASRPALVDADGDAFEAWARDLLARFDRFRVLCAVREGPWGVVRLNAAIEAALRQAGLIEPHGEWYEGRPVMVTRNDASLGVFNGDIGVVLRPPSAGPVGEFGGGPNEGSGDRPGPTHAPLRVYFLEGSGLRSVAVGRLADVETAFAMTVHKAQGSEFDHVVLVLPPDAARVLTRELVYTGITRARKAFTLVASEASQLAAASARLTRRVSGLSALLGFASAP